MISVANYIRERNIWDGEQSWLLKRRDGRSPYRLHVDIDPQTHTNERGVSDGFRQVRKNRLRPRNRLHSVKGSRAKFSNEENV